MMRLIRAQDYNEASRHAGNFIFAQILTKPDCVLGLATGSTPCGTYARLVELYHNGDLDFSGVTTVNLDEYVGLPVEHYESYRSFMNRNLFDHVNIRHSNTYLPNGLSRALKKECENYEEQIKSLGGIDLQLLGIGHNGHIGFNEPSDTFTANTHCVTLTKSTIQANARFFDSSKEVPKRAISMGIRTIMQARKLLLLVTGTEKAQILYDALFGPITPQVPGSIVQLHPDLIVVADSDALQIIEEKGL